MGIDGLSVVSILLVSMASIAAPSQTRTALNSSRIPTVAQKLQEHHVGLTKPELLAALQSAEGEVRSLAATMLADEQATDAIPAILRSMSIETDPATRLNIAYALTRLGETRGNTALRESCQDATLVGFIRVRAASYLLTQHDDSCLEAIETLLQSRDDPGTRAQALSILPQYQNLSVSQSRRTKQIVIESLTDADPSVRIVASETLVALGNSSDIPYLRRAIALERDATVQSDMQSALQRLEKKKRQ